MPEWNAGIRKPKTRNCQGKKPQRVGRHLARQLSVKFDMPRVALSRTWGATYHPSVYSVFCYHGLEPPCGWRENRKRTTHQEFNLTLSMSCARQKKQKDKSARAGLATFFKPSMPAGCRVHTERTGTDQNWSEEAHAGSQGLKGHFKISRLRHELAPFSRKFNIS